MNAGSKYDLILMDIIMPNLDGVSACHLIRQFDQTPIIAMTSNIRSDDITMYFNHGKVPECPCNGAGSNGRRHERRLAETLHQRGPFAAARKASRSSQKTPRGDGGHHTALALIDAPKLNHPVPQG